MKVAYISMQFPSRPETFATTDVRVLRESGVDVNVYALRSTRGDVAALLDERGLSGLFVDQGGLRGSLGGLLACFGSPRLAARLVSWIVRSTWKQPVQLLTSLLLVPRSLRILALLRRDAPDVVHLFWGHYPSLVGWLVLRGLPETVLSVFLGAYDLIRVYGGSPWVARRADLVWTHAAVNIPALLALGVPENRLRLGYRGLDTRLFRPPGGPKIRYRILSVARLIPSKGLDDVLLVFQAVFSSWRDATLVVVGDGPERRNLERVCRRLGIEHAVEFRGHVPHRDVAKEMAAAEILLLMSRKESERLPNVVKEAMASRCVCIVTKTPGIDELVRDGVDGLLVNQGDIEGAAGRIDAVFGGSVDVDRLREAAASRIARDFDASICMDVYRRQWTDAVSERRRDLRQRREREHQVVGRFGTAERWSERNGIAP